MSDFKILCKKDEVPVKRAKVFLLEGKKVGIYFNGKNYFAFAPTCPHANANLKLGRYTDSTVTCRWHNWKFDLESGKGLNNESQLKIFQTKIDNDNILVSLEPTVEENENFFPDIEWK